MKKFRFSLETVLGYKQQELDARKGEHAAVLARLRRQEAALEEAERRYSDWNEEFRSRKMTGLTVAEAMYYDSGLRVLEEEIRKEAAKLQIVQKEEEGKRAQVVAAKQDTSSLEKLKERKLESYNKEFQKSEEAFVDEIVSAARAAARSVS